MHISKSINPLNPEIMKKIHGPVSFLPPSKMLKDTESCAQISTGTRRTSRSQELAASINLPQKLACNIY
jgi:hypothetical protein